MCFIWFHNQVGIVQSLCVAVLLSLSEAFLSLLILGWTFFKICDLFIFSVFRKLQYLDLISMLPFFHCDFYFCH